MVSYLKANDPWDLSYHSSVRLKKEPTYTDLSLRQKQYSKCRTIFSLCKKKLTYYMKFTWSDVQVNENKKKKNSVVHVWI